jgi:hypothetical protein
MSENGRVGDEQDPRSYVSWSASGYEGPPPWRRWFRPGYLVLGLVLAGALAVAFWLAASGRMP